MKKKLNLALLTSKTNQQRFQLKLTCINRIPGAQLFLGQKNPSMIQLMISKKTLNLRTLYSALFMKQESRKKQSLSYLKVLNTLLAKQRTSQTKVLSLQPNLMLKTILQISFFTIQILLLKQSIAKICLSTMMAISFLVKVNFHLVALFTSINRQKVPKMWEISRISSTIMTSEYNSQGKTNMKTQTKFYSAAVELKATMKTSLIESLKVYCN